MTELHEGKHMNTIRVNTVVLGTGSRNTQTNSRADPEMEKGKEGGGGGGGGGVDLCTMCLLLRKLRMQGRLS